MTVVAGSLTFPAEATPPRTSGEEFFRTEDVYSGLGEPIPGGQIARWLLVEGPHIDSGVELFDELCWRLFGDDVPLWRATYHVGVLHPQIRGIGLRWADEPLACEAVDDAVRPGSYAASQVAALCYGSER